MRFQHVRTGKIIDVADEDAHRYVNNRYEEVGGAVSLNDVPQGTVAEVLEWAGVDARRRIAALAVEAVGKNRKGIVEGLTDKRPFG